MAPKPITENTLFYGDNLLVLRQQAQDESFKDRLGNDY